MYQYRLIEPKPSGLSRSRAEAKPSRAVATLLPNYRKAYWEPFLNFAEGALARQHSVNPSGSAVGKEDPGNTATELDPAARTDVSVMTGLEPGSSNVSPSSSPSPCSSVMSTTAETPLLAQVRSLKITMSVSAPLTMRHSAAGTKHLVDTGSAPGSTVVSSPSNTSTCLSSLKMGETALSSQVPHTTPMSVVESSPIIPSTTVPFGTSWGASTTASVAPLTYLTDGNKSQGNIELVCASTAASAASLVVTTPVPGFPLRSNVSPPPTALPDENELQCGFGSVALSIFTPTSDMSVSPPTNLPGSGSSLSTPLSLPHGNGLANSLWADSSSLARTINHLSAVPASGDLVAFEGAFDGGAWPDNGTWTDNFNMDCWPTESMDDFPDNYKSLRSLPQVQTGWFEADDYRLNDSQTSDAMKEPFVAFSMIPNQVAVAANGPSSSFVTSLIPIFAQTSGAVPQVSAVPMLQNLTALACSQAGAAMTSETSPASIPPPTVPAQTPVQTSISMIPPPIPTSSSTSAVTSTVRQTPSSPPAKMNLGASLFVAYMEKNPGSIRTFSDDELHDFLTPFATAEENGVGASTHAARGRGAGTRRGSGTTRGHGPSKTLSMKYGGKTSTLSAATTVTPVTATPLGPNIPVVQEKENIDLNSTSVEPLAHTPPHSPPRIRRKSSADQCCSHP
ncbi:hypothetical protein BDP27DRAFT_1372718 [Rhodocollybia butyracea]|uniref:Uncharacterized protein n=1 Tax=Rhodocollybia butyracea TaxID=206335 RepID=A0A9P5P8U7_9AGAR|nr:hypothetical protein BDP27DRAFT_1372718 [Rhodocollybia butyracea]